MSKSFFTSALKLLIAAAVLCGTLVYVWVLPSLGNSIRIAVPSHSGCYYPWLIFLWLTAIPCYGAALSAWKIVRNIGQDHPFTFENARLLKRISLFALADAVFLLAGNILFLFLNMNHPSVLLCSLGISIIGGVVWIICSGLSLLTQRAAQLQEQSDLTI